MIFNTSDAVATHLKKLSKDVRSAAQKKQRFRQFVRPETSFTTHMSDTYQFTKVGNIEEEARTISEDGDIPQGKPAITSDLVTAEEKSLELPYTSRSVILSELSLESIFVRKLMDHAVKTLDKISAVPFRQADLVYTPVGTLGSKDYTLGTAGVALDTATRPFSLWDLRNLRSIMQNDHDVPGFAGSDEYIFIVTDKIARSLKEDSQYIELAKHAYPEKALAGELGMLEGFRIIQENNVLDNNLPGGLGEGVAFGDDPVIEIEIWPLELQRAISESYGRTKAIRWTWYGGFKKTWNFAAEGQVRIVRVYSLP